MLGELFVKLIKMMIIPVIFCTVVIGIGKLRAAAVGKVGGLALAYFLVMSTFALAIGLVVGNLIKPGEGLKSRATRARAQSSPVRHTPRAGRWSSSATSFRTRCSPR